MEIFDNNTYSYSLRELESTDYFNQYQSTYVSSRPIARTGTRTRKLRLGANVGHKSKVISSRRKKNKSAKRARRKNR